MMTSCITFGSSSAVAAFRPARARSRCSTGALALAVALAFAALGTRAASAQESARPKYYYPTAARADYVIGCLAANGFNRLYLEKCACGIDTIANMLPYDDYEKASTILSMQQGRLGPRGTLFRGTPIAKEELKKLHEAEAEVNLRCR